MRISDAEVKKVLSHPEVESPVVDAIVEIEDARVREQDQDLVQELTAAIPLMPDREAIVEALRAQVEAGTYRPSADDIVDGMVRRYIADQIR